MIAPTNTNPQEISNRATAAFIGLQGLANSKKKKFSFEEYAVCLAMENVLAWVINSPVGRVDAVDGFLEMAMEDGEQQLLQARAEGGSTG